MSVDIQTTLNPPQVVLTNLQVGQGPAGVGLNPAAGVAAEALNAGMLVNIFAGGVRKASNDYISKQAHGFVVDSVGIGDPVTVHFIGQNTFFAGLTIGPVYLGLNGMAMSVPLHVGPGVSQCIGWATEDDKLNFLAGMVVVLAGTQP